MKAVFEVKEIVSRWSPPFDKKIKTEECSVPVNGLFSRFNGSDESVFRLVELGKRRAKVEFDHRFTLKGHEHPANRQVWLEMGEEVSFTYLWGEKGITKKLLLKGVEGLKQQDEDFPEEDEESEEEEEETFPGPNGDEEALQDSQPEDKEVPDKPYEETNDSGESEESQENLAG